MKLNCGVREWNSTVECENETQLWSVRMKLNCGVREWNSTVECENGTQLWSARMNLNCGVREWSMRIKLDRGVREAAYSLLLPLAKILTYSNHHIQPGTQL